MTRLPKLLAVAGMALGMAACSESTSPPGTNLAQDQSDVASSLADDSALFGETDFGATGGAPMYSVVATSDAAPAAGSLPVHWGRFRRPPDPVINRNITIVGDTASVVLTVTFGGVLKVDRTDDGVRNPGDQPLNEELVQQAKYARLATPTATGRRWKLVGITPQDYRQQDPARRTVTINEVRISVNGETTTITDPHALISAEDRLPLIHTGDQVTIETRFTNTTNSGFAPPEYVFIHLRHATPGDFWVRSPMRDDGQNGDQAANDGVFSFQWTAFRTGRERMAIDVIDAAALNNETGDFYRSEVWAIPYRLQAR